MTNAPKRDVLVSEVGPRDGLQSIQAIMPLAAKKAWVTAAAAAGVPEEQWAAYADALRGLAATDMIRPRATEVAA